MNGYTLQQVTTRNGISPAKPGEAAADSPAAGEAIEPRATWRHRVRSLLCCLSPPATDRYYRSSETEAVVLRRPAQSVPPHRYTGSPVIGPMSAGDVGKKTLVLDLDETLVHSSFKPIPNPDYIIPVRTQHAMYAGLELLFFGLFKNTAALAVVIAVCRAFLAPSADPAQGIVFVHPYKFSLPCMRPLSA